MDKQMVYSEMFGLIFRTLEAIVYFGEHVVENKNDSQTFSGTVLTVRAYDAENPLDTGIRTINSCHNLPQFVTYETSDGLTLSNYSPIETTTMGDHTFRFFKQYNVGDGFP